MIGFRTKFCVSFHCQTLNLLHNFHSLLHVSTLTSTSADVSTQSIANYLLNSLGFSPKKSTSIATNLHNNNKVLVGFKFSENADSVIHFLRQHGFDDSRIHKTVSSYPLILLSNVDKTLKPQFKLLQNHGFSGSDLIRVISLNPMFFITHFNHTFPDISVIMGSAENSTMLLKKFSCYITLGKLQNLISNVGLLTNEYNIDIQVIRNVLLLKERPFLQKTELFRKLVNRVAVELQIPAQSRMFVYGIYLLSSISEKRFESRRQVFKSFGWTECHVAELIRSSPCAFLPSEENMRRKLEFFMKELGYDPDYLAAHSALFTYSLEKRLMPRHRVLRVLKGKGWLDYNFYTAVLRTEAQFLKLIVEPFMEAMPNLLDIYQNSKEPKTDVDSLLR